MIQSISKTGLILQNINNLYNFEDPKLFFWFNSFQSITYQKTLPWPHFGSCSSSLDMGLTKRSKKKYV